MRGPEAWLLEQKRCGLRVALPQGTYGEWGSLVRACYKNKRETEIDRVLGPTAGTARVNQ